MSKATKMARERRQRALFLDGAKENEEEEKRGVLGKDEDQQRGGFSLSEEEEGKAVGEVIVGAEGLREIVQGGKIEFDR